MPLIQWASRPCHIVRGRQAKQRPPPPVEKRRANDRLRLRRLTSGGPPAKAALREARWRSGYAEDCKSLHAGSIPARASTFPPALSISGRRRPESGRFGARGALRRVVRLSSNSMTKPTARDVPSAAVRPRQADRSKARCAGSQLCYCFAQGERASWASSRGSWNSRRPHRRPGRRRGGQLCAADGRRRCRRRRFRSEGSVPARPSASAPGQPITATAMPIGSRIWRS